MTVDPLNGELGGRAPEKFFWGGVIHQFALDIRPLFLAVFQHMVFTDGFLIVVKELGLFTNPGYWIRDLDAMRSYMYIVL
jgi:hypothetical protein